MHLKGCCTGGVLSFCRSVPLPLSATSYLSLSFISLPLLIVSESVMRMHNSPRNNISAWHPAGNAQKNKKKSNLKPLLMLGIGTMDLGFVRTVSESAASLSAYRLYLFVTDCVAGQNRG